MEQKPPISEPSEPLPTYQYGYYFIDTNNHIVHQRRTVPPPDAPSSSIDEQLDPDKGRLQRVEYRSLGDMKTNKVLVVDGTGLHPDEKETGVIAYTVFHKQNFRRTEIYTAHPLATYFDSRFYVVPYTEENDRHWNPEQNPDYYVALPNFKAGITVDLNRQFTVPDSTTLYPEAKLALKVVEDSPSTQLVVTYHEDCDATGPYFYDCAPDARTDGDRHFIHELHTNYAAELRRNGLEPFTGIDDIQDPMLGHQVVNGLVYLPVIQENGTRTEDTSFENAVVALGVGRSFCLETPQQYTEEQKKLSVIVFNNTVMMPYLKAKGLYEEM